VSKSYVGNGVFIAASKLGKKGLKQVRAERHGRTMFGTERNPKGVYQRKAGDEKYNEEAAFNLHAARAQMSQMTGRDMSKKPKGTGKNNMEKVPTLDPSYKNAHPMIWGKKGDGFYMVSGKKFANNKSTIAHESLHAEKSSWRMAQIQVDPVKRAREEARADTLSGTHKEIHANPLLRSHTEVNRKMDREAPKYEAKAKKARAKTEGQDPDSLWATISGARADTYESAAKQGRAFADTQDRIDASGKFKTKQSRRRVQRVRQVQRVAAVGTAGGGAGAYAWNESKYKRGRDGKFTSK
jgi:hypothetical protein